MVGGKGDGLINIPSRRSLEKPPPKTQDQYWEFVILWLGSLETPSGVDAPETKGSRAQHPLH